MNRKTDLIFFKVDVEIRNSINNSNYTISIAY